MYYVMQRDTQLSGKYVYVRDEPDGYDGDEWRTGEKMERPPSPMTLVFDDDRTSQLSDMLLNAADLQVYSPQLVASLEAAGVDNLQYFPIRVRDAKTGKSRDDYVVANIVGRISCVDIEHSNVRYFRNSKDIRSVEEFRIFEDRIAPLPGRKSPPLIFRLGESEFVVLAHESIKSQFTRDGITGAKFVRTEEFVG